MECWTTRCQASLIGLLAVSCNIVLCRWRTDVLFFFFFFLLLFLGLLSTSVSSLHVVRGQILGNITWFCFYVVSRGMMLRCVFTSVLTDLWVFLTSCPLCPFRPLLMPLIPDSCVLILWWLLSHEFGFLFLFVELNI